MAEKRCVLYDRECIECGECNLCDLDPTKVCDNCGKCIGLNLGKTVRSIAQSGSMELSTKPWIRKSIYMMMRKRWAATTTTLWMMTICFRLCGATDKNENQACFAKSFDKKHA